MEGERLEPECPASLEGRYLLPGRHTGDISGYRSPNAMCRWWHQDETRLGYRGHVLVRTARQA